MKQFPEGQLQAECGVTVVTVVLYTNCLNIFDVIRHWNSKFTQSEILYWYVRNWVWLQIFTERSGTNTFPTLEKFSSEFHVVPFRWCSVLGGVRGWGGGGVSHILRWHLSPLTIIQIMTNKIHSQIAVHSIGRQIFWYYFEFHKFVIVADVLTLSIDINDENILISVSSQLVVQECWRVGGLWCHSVSLIYLFKRNVENLKIRKCPLLKSAIICLCAM